MGGFLQYLSILTPTQTNFIILFLFFPFFSYVGFWRQLYREKILILMCFYIIFVGVITESSLTNTVTYIYYLICTLFSAAVSRTICEFNINKYGTQGAINKLIKISKFFLIIQFFICFFQYLFVEKVVAYAPYPILLEDAVFGTMFIKSDASLAAITQLLVVSIFLFPSLMRDKIIFSFLSICIIFFGGSKAAQSLVCLTLVLSWLAFFYTKLKLKKSGFKYLFTGITVFVSLFLIFIYGRLLLNDFIEYSVSAYNKRDSWTSADRLAPFGQFFSEDLSFFGNGPLTYYNPFNQSWLYDSGFSTFYSLYIDLGLVGIILYLLYYINRIWLAFRSVFIFFIFFIIVIIYSAFSLTLSDMAFAFSINYILWIFYISQKKI